MFQSIIHGLLKGFICRCFSTLGLGFLYSPVPLLPFQGGMFKFCGYWFNSDQLLQLLSSQTSQLTQCKAAAGQSVSKLRALSTGSFSFSELFPVRKTNTPGQVETRPPTVGTAQELFQPHLTPQETTSSLVFLSSVRSPAPVYLFC